MKQVIHYQLLETLQFGASSLNLLNRKRRPQLSDIELIAVDLTPEFLGLDSERNLFKNN